MLELACGPGAVGLAAAALVAPGGEVRELDLEQIDEPGGAYDVAVWGPRERNPWLGVVFDVVSAGLGAPMPPSGIPGPFSLEDADGLAGLLADAGLADVEVGELSTPYHAASVEEWWTRTCALAGPLAQRLAALPEPAAQALRARAGEAISAYETPRGLEIPGVSLIAAAARR